MIWTLSTIGICMLAYTAYGIYHLGKAMEGY